MNAYVETTIEKDERKITFWIYCIYLNSILHSWWRGTMQKCFLLWSFALSSPYEYTDIQKHSCSHTLFSQVWQKVQRPLGNNLNNMADTVTAKLFVYTNENQVTKIQLPDSITALGDSAFYGYSGLTTIQLPDSITTLGNDAFRDCTGLTAIKLPDSITTLGNNVFLNCSSLTTIQLPDLITTLGYGVFHVCSSLTTIQLPNSITTLREGVFSNCSGLTTIQLPDPTRLQRLVIMYLQAAAAWRKYNSLTRL